MGILNKLLEGIQYIEKLTTKPADSEEKKMQAALKRNLQSLTVNADETDSHWIDSVQELLGFIEHHDARYFLHCDTVRFNMFANASYTEYRYLMNHKNRQLIRKMLIEDRIGNPKRYPYYPKSSSNLIHHAYSMQYGLDRLQLSIKDLNSIFEFGGGYGSFCRLFFHGLFSGSYTIFDLQAYSLLQQYFLEHAIELPIHLGRYDSKGPCANLIYNDEQLSTVKDGIGLFVALWSLSECPEEVRDKIFDSINCDNYLIAYSHLFQGKDNTTYFNSLEKRFVGYSIIHHEIEHLKGHSYFIAKKNIFL